MGTKSNPGAFNCYGAALPDEPIFTILGRDPTFRATILYWMAQRGIEGKNETEEDLDRITEAANVAEKGREWRLANLDPVGDGIPSWKLPRPTPEIGEDRPVRMEPALGAPYGGEPYNAGQTIRKILTGLRQVTADMMRDEMDAMVNEKHVDRINGYVLELASLNIMEDREIETNTFNMDAEVVRVEDLSERELEAIRTAQPGAVTAESDFVDLAEVPESEVPPHRFSYFYKYGGYAYARGLEINPAHLPRALDAMTEDGWHLLAIFGATDSKHVGFIFRRQFEENEFLLDPSMERSAVELRGVSGEPKDTAFLTSLSPLLRVQFVYQALAERGEDCRRYGVSILSASGLYVDDCGQLYGRTGDVLSLGHVASRLEAAYFTELDDDAGCTGLGHGQEP